MMNSKKNKFISGLLSFVMVMTMVLEILPPIEAGAAEFSISVPKDGDTYWLEDMSQPYNILYEKYADAVQHWVTITDLSDYSDIFETITESEIVSVDRNLFEYGGEYRVTVIPLDNLGDPIGGGTFSISNEFSVHDEMYLNFSENDMQVSSESNTYYIDVETNNDDLSWTIGESVSWLTFSPASGTGSTEVKVKVSNYDKTEDRVAYVNLQNKKYDFKYQLKVTQSGIDYTPHLEVTEDSLTFSSESGDIKTFKIKSNESWELDYPEWVTCEPDSKTITTGNTNTTTVTVTTISENTSSSANRGTIYIETDNCETEVEVTQEGSDIPEQEEHHPTITFNVSPTTVTEGEKITFSGLADGDGYKINAVSIGVAYYESEEKYYEEQNKEDPSADDAVYLREPNISVDTFDYSSIKDGSIPTGSDEPLKGELDVEGEYVPYEILMRPGVYTFTAHAYSDEYGKEFEQVSKTVRIEPDEEIQEEIQLDSFKITNTNTTVNRGSSYMLEWDAPANAPDGTTYSIFVWEYSNTTEVGSTTDTWFEIPSKCFANAEVVAITVYANADGYKQSECEETLNVTVIEDDTKTPCVTSVVPDPPAGDMNTTYTFTAYAENTDTVVFYMNSTKIATVTGSNGEFVCSYSGFRKAGTRTVFAYPIDSNGNEIRTEGCYASAEITIEAEGNLENIKYITESYQNIDVNSSFELAWERPENAPEDIDISYIIYVHNDDGRVGDEFEESSESTVIPASYFAEEGRYTISVYAVADNWSQSEYSAITVYVEASVPTISGYRLSHTTIPRDGSFTMKGTVDGNGDNLTEILVKAVNTSSGTSVELYSDSLNDSEFDLADIPALCPANSGLTEAGTYTISVYAKTVGATSATLLGKSSLYISSDSKIILDTPQLNGTSTLEYGENYIISWNYDSAVDYYSISVGGYSTKMTADASEGSYSIPASIFKKLSSGSSYNCTIYVQAMSKDTANYLSSATAEKKITVAGKAEATAIIKSAEIIGLSADKVIIGGTEVEFEVVTSTDVTALRMKDGAGSFIVNTWTTGYTDSGEDRIWMVTQKVNYAGGNDATGAKRMLTFYSMIGDIEYNTYNISFYCQKGDTIGTFSVLTPKNESAQDEGKSLRITWSEPQNTEVDLYILDVVHNNQSVVREEIRGACEYTLDGSYLVRDNNAWKIQVTARKDAGQWSESSAFATFTLNCTHEKKNPSSERVLSYTNTGNGHRMEVEITSTCNGCGLEIVEDDPEIRTEEHKFVYLTEGGKVCNCCWYLVNDGTFTDTKEYIAKEKSYAYTNVRKDGTPYGVQYVNGNKSSIRTIFAGDKITIIGKLNGCCLVEYPISGGVSARSSGGYWYGFVKESVLDEKKEDNIEIKSPEQQIVDEYLVRRKLCEKNLGIDVSRDEFTLAFNGNDVTSALNESIISTIAYNITNNWRTGGKYAVSTIVNVFNPGLADSMVESAITDLTHEILTAVCSKMPTGDTFDEEYKEINADTYLLTVYEFLSKSTETVSNASSLLESSSVAADVWAITEGILNDTSGAIIGTTANVAAKSIQLLILKLQCNLRTFDVLADSFNDPTYYSAVMKLKFEYLNSNLSIIEELGRSLAESGIKLIASAICPPLGVALKMIDIASFIKSIIGDFPVEYLDDIASSDILFDVVKKQYNEYIESYKKSKDISYKNVLAPKIIELYRIVQGFQIFLNEQSIPLCMDEYRAELLQEEINHLQNTPITNWKINPYYSELSPEIPDYSMVSYYLKILLDGYPDQDDDGILGHWENKAPNNITPYYKKLIVEQVERMIEFNQGCDFSSDSIIKMYILNNGTKSTEGTSGFLFVNKEGMGLFLGYIRNQCFICNKSFPRCFKILSKVEVNSIFEGNKKFPAPLFTLSYERAGCSDVARSYCIYNWENEYEGVTIFDNPSINDIPICNRYISKEISGANFLEVLKYITSYENYKTVRTENDITKILALLSTNYNFWLDNNMENFAKQMHASIIDN